MTVPLQSNSNLPGCSITFHDVHGEKCIKNADRFFLGVLQVLPLLVSLENAAALDCLGVVWKAQFPYHPMLMANVYHQKREASKNCPSFRDDTVDGSGIR